MAEELILENLGEERAANWVSYRKMLVINGKVYMNYILHPPEYPFINKGFALTYDPSIKTAKDLDSRNHNAGLLNCESNPELCTFLSEERIQEIFKKEKGDLVVERKILLWKFLRASFMSESFPEGGYYYWRVRYYDQGKIMEIDINAHNGEIVSDERTEEDMDDVIIIEKEETDQK